MSGRSSSAGPSSGLAGFTSKLASYLPSSRPSRSAHDGPVGAISASESDDDDDAAEAAGANSSDWDWRSARRSTASNFDDADAISLLSDIADRNASRRRRRRGRLTGWRRSIENLKVDRVCAGPAEMMGGCLGRKRRTRRAGSSDEEDEDEDEENGSATPGWSAGWIADCLGGRRKETDPQRRARAWRGEQSRLGEDQALLDDASDAGSDAGSRGQAGSGRGWGDEEDALENEDYHETIRRLSTTSGGESSQGPLSGEEDARSVGDVDVSAIPPTLLVDTEPVESEQAAPEEEFGELQSGTVRLPDQDKRAVKLGTSTELVEGPPAVSDPADTSPQKPAEEEAVATSATESKADEEQEDEVAPTTTRPDPVDESQIGEDTLTATAAPPEADISSGPDADTTATEAVTASDGPDAAATTSIEEATQSDALATLSSEPVAVEEEVDEPSRKPKAPPRPGSALASEDEDAEDDDDRLSIATTQVTDSAIPPALSPAALEGLSPEEAAALKAERRAERRAAREKLLRLRIEAEMRAKGRFRTEAEAEAAAGGFGLEEQDGEGEDWAKNDAEVEEHIRERMREEEEERKRRKRERKAERRAAREAEWQRYQEEYGDYDGEEGAEHQPQQEVVVHHHYYHEPSEPHGDDYDHDAEGGDNFADDSREGLYTTFSPEAFQFPANPVKPQVDDEAGQDEEGEEEDDEEEADMAGLGLARSKRRQYGGAGGSSSQGSGSRRGYTARSGADGSRSNASGSNAGTRRERPSSAQAMDDDRLAPPDHDDVAALLGSGGGTSSRSRGSVGEGSAGSGSRQAHSGGGGGYREKSGRPARGHRREASRSTNNSSKGREGLGLPISPTPGSGVMDKGSWSPTAVAVPEEGREGDDAALPRRTRERSEADADAAAGGFGDFVLPSPADEDRSQPRHLDIPSVSSPTSPQQASSSSSYRDRERRRMGGAAPSVSSGGSNSQSGRTRRREGPSSRRAA